MSTTYATTDNIGAGTRVALTSNDQDYVVLEGVTVASTSYNAIDSIWSDIDVTVLGTVIGDYVGVFLGDDPAADYGQSLKIGADGWLQGGTYGALLYGSGSKVINEGTLVAETYALTLYASGSSYTTVENFGLIQSDYIAIYTSSSETVELTNTGTISGDYAYFSGYSGVDLLRNRGTLDGTVTLFNGNDVLDNRGGSIEGPAYLGAGDDSFDNRRGGLVTGTVYGEAGNDTFRPGSEAEDLDGGADVDTLDFRGSAGLRVSLADGTGTGLAEGDTYTGFEVVLGSRGGADTLIGDGLANTLRGFGGADSLVGGAGNDLLWGDDGADTVTGGAGDDAIRLLAPTDGADTVADFSSNAAGNNDRVEVAAAGFGTGLAAGGLDTGTLASGRFQSRADNLAQDSNDRFIFRTTDQTLWWDADGTGAQAPVLLLDLQAGASMTYADLVLV